MIWVRDVSTGECRSFGTDKAGYCKALAFYNSILSLGHMADSNKSLQELEYGAY